MNFRESPRTQSTASWEADKVVRMANHQIDKITDIRSVRAAHTLDRERLLGLLALAGGCDRRPKAAGNYGVVNITEDSAALLTKEFV